MSAYVSAIARLREIPHVFTGADVMQLCGWTSQIASTYLSNWRKAGHILPLGGHSDVYLNLVVNPRGDREAALLRCYPAATLAGTDILRAAGWTTQIMAKPEVVIPSGSKIYAIDFYTLLLRPPSWWRKVMLEEHISGRAARLRPASALADMLHRAHDARAKDAWLLAPDDLDLDMAREDESLPTTFAAFKLPLHLVSDAGYADFYKAWQEQSPLKTENGAH